MSIALSNKAETPPATRRLKQEGYRRSPVGDVVSVPSEQAPFNITLNDELFTDYVLDTDLVLAGRRENRVTIFDSEPMAVAGDVRPSIIVGTRVYMNEDGAVRLALPLGEPLLERRHGCIVVRRVRREVIVEGKIELLWNLLRVMDGLRSAAEILVELQSEREATAHLLACLGAVGAVDASGRPLGRFLHAATKKGVLPGGDLSLNEVLNLVTDGNYRVYPYSPTIAINGEVPEALEPLHCITRARRSYRDYNGKPIARADFESLLNTACGVTGSLEWAGRELKLRSYPSSGGLYSVEIYPVVFAVAGVDSAVYHYRATESALSVVRCNIDRQDFLDAALPEEREMLGGVAAMICLSGVFARHELKYGEGGYRMIVAEAGHISQNLILAATALGLHARPFGGVFDELLNRALGFEADDEQFLLSVIVGYTGEKY